MSIITNSQLSAAAILMDDELREQLHSDLGECTAEEFLAAYRAAHYQKFGEKFEF